MDEPKSNSSKAKVEHKSTDSTEDTSNVGLSEKEQEIVKSDGSSKAEVAKGK